MFIEIVELKAIETEVRFNKNFNLVCKTKIRNNIIWKQNGTLIRNNTRVSRFRLKDGILY